jgi:NhaP-type Na+/H+ or K+/H+ antiporter
VLTVEGCSYNDYPVWAINAKKENKLNQFQMFFIRAIIGLFVAVIITRMFTGRIHIPYIAGLAIILVGLAYFSEYLRQRRDK